MIKRLGQSHERHGTRRGDACGHHALASSIPYLTYLVPFIWGPKVDSLALTVNDREVLVEQHDPRRVRVLWLGKRHLADNVPEREVLYMDEQILEERPLIRYTLQQ